MQEYESITDVLIILTKELYCNLSEQAIIEQAIILGLAFDALQLAIASNNFHMIGTVSWILMLLQTSSRESMLVVNAYNG